MKTYTLQDSKPEFRYGQEIFIDKSSLGTGTGVEVAKVVGKGMVHVIDFWLVEFRHDFGIGYPYRVVQVPHTAIVKKI